MEYLASQQGSRMPVDDEIDKEKGLLAKLEVKMQQLYQDLG